LTDLPTDKDGKTMAKTIITATPPTPNGDLHVGHLSGPYLAADVHARFLRARGHDVAYVSSSDDNQSYVVTTAHRLGMEPKALAAQQAERIRETLAMASIAIDAFTVPDWRHDELVRQFFRRLYDDGVLTRKKRAVFWCAEHKHYAFESYLRGTCSLCFSPTAGAICEACGHPNDAKTILDPQCSIDPGHTLELQEIDVVVLELERYRTELREFYVDKWRTWRPHPLRLVEELLEKPLPDYPVTYISDWGIPAPFPGCDGQVLNVWAEMLPGLMRTVEWVETQRGNRNVDGEALWHPASGNRLIQFLGYDNSFFFAVVHVVLALAIRDRCILPTSIMTNEFYQLENFKFSTSKNHAIWARDLLAHRSVDEVRFYLALSNPEFQKTNFAQGEMDKLVATSFTGPWQALAGGLDRLSRAQPGRAKSGHEISAETRALIEQLVGSFERYYSIETFSLQRIAEVFSQLLIWLGRRANAVADASPGGSGASADADQVWMITRLIPSLVSPLLPDLAGRLDKVLAQTTCHQWPGSERLASGVTPVSTVGQILPPPRA
jgi:methionyl-tRNA synthetase